VTNDSLAPLFVTAVFFWAAYTLNKGAVRLTNEGEAAYTFAQDKAQDEIVRQFKLARFTVLACKGTIYRVGGAMTLVAWFGVSFLERHSFNDLWHAISAWISGSG
jgi:hypothetical protein